MNSTEPREAIPPPLPGHGRSCGCSREVRSPSSLLEDDCSLIIASDLNIRVDAFGEPILRGAWYWAWEETILVGVESWGSPRFEPFFHIESGPVSPLTFTK